MKLAIRPIEDQGAEVIASAFKRIGWHKPVAQYRRYLREQQRGTRSVLVAWADGKFAGYLTIVWKTRYPLFRKKHIPEIVDLNVLPRFRRKRIGTRLNKAEAMIRTRSSFAGIGVGLAPGYEAAQRMCVRRGYMPDGLGVCYKDKPVKFGQRLTINDDLVLHFIKKLR